MAKIINFLSPRRVAKLINYWPPFFFSGIKVKEVDHNLKKIIVQMKQWPWNTNYIGTHFGGSLYSMTDPFYMFMLLHQLKKDHIIWDQAADIKFLKPGRGTVTAEFSLRDEDVTAIKNRALKEFSHSVCFDVEVKNKQGEVVSLIKKTLYVRRKDAKGRFPRN